MASWFNIVGQEQYTLSQAEKPTLSDDPDAYGDVFVYDTVPAVETIQLEGEGFEASEVAAWRTAIRTRNAMVTVADFAGTSYTGRPISLSISQREGTPTYKVSMTLRRTGGG